jgi:hypothetical protein
MFASVFQPREVKDTLLALDRLAYDSTNLAMPEVQRLVRKAILADPGKVVGSIRADRLQPKTLVWLLTSNVLDRQLSSGSLHTYRGMLSIIGNSMLTLWDAAADNLAETGFYSAEQAARDKAHIREQIRRAG